ALGATPGNQALRLVLAETLAAEGDGAAAVEEYDRLFSERQLPAESLVAAGRAALDAGRQDRAQVFAEAASANGLVEDASELKSEIDASLGLKGMVPMLRPGGGIGAIDEEEPAELELDAERAVTFADVGGLDDVKKTINRTI